MAKKETNDAKRTEMKNLVAACIERGWTPATLAAYFRFSSFGPFVHGTSMGTNDLRAELGALCSFSEAVSRGSIAEHIEQLKVSVAKAEAELAKQQARQPKSEEAYLAGMSTYERDGAKKWPEAYSYATYLKQEASGKEWSINRATNTLNSNRKWLKALQKAV